MKESEQVLTTPPSEDRNEEISCEDSDEDGDILYVQGFVKVIKHFGKRAAVLKIGNSEFSFAGKFPIRRGKSVASTKAKNSDQNDNRKATSVPPFKKASVQQSTKPLYKARDATQAVKLEEEKKDGEAAAFRMQFQNSDKPETSIEDDPEKTVLRFKAKPKESPSKPIVKKQLTFVRSAARKESLAPTKSLSSRPKQTSTAELISKDDEKSERLKEIAIEPSKEEDKLAEKAAATKVGSQSTSLIMKGKSAMPIKKAAGEKKTCGSIKRGIHCSS